MRKCAQGGVVYMSNTIDESTVAMFDLVNILSGKLLHISAGRTSVWFPIRQLTPCKMSFHTTLKNASSRNTAGPIISCLMSTQRTEYNPYLWGKTALRRLDSWHGFMVEVSSALISSQCCSPPLLRTLFLHWPCGRRHCCLSLCV